MGIVSVTETQRQGSWTWKKYQRQFERHYQVICDGNTDLEGDILAGLPYVPGDNIGAGVYCVKTEVHQQGPDDSGAFFVWQATAHFDSLLDDKQTSTNPATANDQTPTNRTPVFEYDFETLQEAVTEATNGIPVVNSANMPFSPPVEKTYGLGVINIEVNKSAIPNLGAYFNKINNATVTWDGFSYAQYTLLVTGAKAKHVWENNTHYVSVHWTVKYNSATWRRRILDAGFYELVQDGSGSGSGSGSSSGGINAGCGGSAGFRHIVDNYGQPVSAPYPLDGTGRRLPCYETTPVYLPFWFYESVSFSGLP